MQLTMVSDYTKQKTDESTKRNRQTHNYLGNFKVLKKSVREDLNSYSKQLDLVDIQKTF